MMPMQNNPLFAIVQAARGGGNPMQLMQQMAGRTPHGAQFMQMIQGKNGQQMRSIAENMAKERGVSLEQVAQQFGLQLPK